MPVPMRRPGWNDACKHSRHGVEMGCNGSWDQVLEGVLHEEPLVLTSARNLLIDTPLLANDSWTQKWPYRTCRLRSTSLKNPIDEQGGMGLMISSSFLKLPLPGTIDEDWSCRDVILTGRCLAGGAPCGAAAPRGSDACSRRLSPWCYPAIQPVLKPTQFDVLISWFPSSCSSCFFGKMLCFPDAFWAQTCRFPADPKSGPPAPERRSPLRNEFCRAACVRLSHLQRILRKVEHLPEPCQQYGFLALKGLVRIRIITFVRFGASKT